MPATRACTLARRGVHGLTMRTLRMATRLQQGEARARAGACAPPAGCGTPQSCSCPTACSSCPCNTYAAGGSAPAARAGCAGKASQPNRIQRAQVSSAPQARQHAARAVGVADRGAELGHVVLAGAGCVTVSRQGRQFSATRSLPLRRLDRTALARLQPARAVPGPANMMPRLCLPVLTNVHPGSPSATSLLMFLERSILKAARSSMHF